MLSFQMIKLTKLLKHFIDSIGLLENGISPIELSKNLNWTVPYAEEFLLMLKQMGILSTHENEKIRQNKRYIVKNVGDE